MSEHGPDQPATASKRPDMNLQSPIKNPDRFYIGGRWVPPSSSARIQVLHSATEQPFGSVAEAQEADVNAAVQAARAAFDQGPWPRLTPAERAPVLRRFADEMDRLAERGATIWAAESGLLYSTALTITKTLGDFYRWYADLAATFPFVERHPSAAAGCTGLLVREAVGVVAAIIPWNGPPNLAAVKLAPALLAGCSVILKASPEAPGAAYLIAEASENAGLPPGVVNILTADRAVSELLVRHPGVDKVAFTGSTAAGRRIGAICGERIARCSLELGGKSPALVLDDYDIETAAKTIASRATFLSGQVCSSLTRIIVSRQRHDALVDALAAQFAQVAVGDPFDPAMGMGPLATARQRERVEGYIAKGQAEGARLATGGGRPRHLSCGYFVEPTVFGNVDNRSTIAQEEIFGPVLSVIPVADEAQAVAVANDSLYGLGGAVFTHDVDRAYAVARHIRTGTVSHNSHRTEMFIGYGGFKQSGIGREGGVEGLRAFMEAKTISLAGVPTALGVTL